MARLKTFCLRGLTLLGALSMFAACGFLGEPRVSRAYWDAMVPDDEVLCLVTWPVHVLVLPVTATIDQGIRTVEIVPPAAVDAGQYFLLPVGKNNVLFRQTVAVPKALGTPLVFLGSYLARWFYPVDADTTPFAADPP